MLRKNNRYSPIDLICFHCDIFTFISLSLEWIHQFLKSNKVMFFCFFFVFFAKLVLMLMIYFFEELAFHYSLHTSLDVIEEKLTNTSSKGNDHRFVLTLFCISSPIYISIVISRFQFRIGLMIDDYNNNNIVYCQNIRLI